MDNRARLTVMVNVFIAGIPVPDSSNMQIRYMKD